MEDSLNSNNPKDTESVSSGSRSARSKKSEPVSNPRRKSGISKSYDKRNDVGFKFKTTYFQSQLTLDKATQEIMWIVKLEVNIDGKTYLPKERVSNNVVEAWIKAGAASKTTDLRKGTSGTHTFGNPNDSQDPTYPSPMEGDNAYWCWSRRNERLTQTPKERNMLVPPTNPFAIPDKITTRSTSTYHATKQEFSHSVSNPFKYTKVSYSSFRRIQDKIIEHFQLDERAQQVYSLYKCFKKDFQSDLIARLKTQKDFASNDKNRHRLDGGYLVSKINDAYLEGLTPLEMIPMLLIAVLPITDTQSEYSHQSAVESIISYELRLMSDSQHSLLQNKDRFIVNYGKIHETFTETMLEITRFVRITEWWISDWYPVKSNNSLQKGFMKIMDESLQEHSRPDSIGLHGFYQLHDCKDKRYNHFSHILTDKVARSSMTNEHLKPSMEYLMKLTNLEVGLTRKPPLSLTTKATLNNMNSSQRSNATTATTVTEGFQSVSLNGMDNDQRDTVTTAPRSTESFQSADNASQPTDAELSSLSQTSSRKEQQSCYVKLIRGVCNVADCNKGSHDESVLARHRVQLSRDWKPDGTMSATVHNLNLVNNLSSISQDQDFSLADVQQFVTNALQQTVILDDADI